MYVSQSYHLRNMFSIFGIPAFVNLCINLLALTASLIVTRTLHQLFVRQYLAIDNGAENGI